MRGTDIRSAVGWTANHNGYPNKPTRHVADTPGVVDNLVVCDISKTPEHQFDNGTKTEHRGADCHADKASFADGCIDNAPIAEFLPKAFGHFVGAVVLGNFFPKDQHVIVPRNFFG
jgi:hypothetical protein